MENEGEIESKRTEVASIKREDKKIKERGSINQRKIGEKKERK